MKDLDAAAKAYTRCLESNPSFLAAYIGRGDVYADAGDHEAAKEQYLMALHQNPDCVEAIVHLGYNLQVITTSDSTMFITEQYLDLACDSLNFKCKTVLCCVGYSNKSCF